MICELCRLTAATMHVTERLPLGGFRECHYCWDCWEANESGRSPDQIWPRPKVRLRSILFVVIGFAVSNFVAVWVIRNLPIARSPEQLKATIYALLMVNSCFAVFVVHRFAATWLRQVIWYKKTGNVRAMPSARAMSRNREVAWLSLSWIVTSNAVANVLNKMLAPHDLVKLCVFVAISVFVGLGYWLAGNTDSIRRSFERFRNAWTASSKVERRLTLVTILWPLGLSLLIRSNAIPISVFRNFNPWFAIPTLLATVFGSHLAFLVAEALSISCGAWGSGLKASAADST